MIFRVTRNGYIQYRGKSFNVVLSILSDPSAPDMTGLEFAVKPSKDSDWIVIAHWA